MAKLTDITTEEAHRRVERKFLENKIEFKRNGDQYNIPNFQHFYGMAVRIAGNALKGTPFFAQEMPYEECCEFKPEYLIIAHCDHFDNK